MHQCKHIYLQMHLAAISTAVGDSFQSVKPQDHTISPQIFLCMYFIMFSGHYSAQFHIGNDTRCPHKKAECGLLSLYPECGFIIIPLKKCTFHCNNIYVWGQYDIFLELINTFI